MKLTRVCSKCKQSFRKEEMIQYASLRAKKALWYCPQCYQERRERELFSDKVCEIFGLKSPGPRIWKERQRLRDTYGYTDNTIIDCLDYIYNVRKTKKLAESLVLVTPRSVEEMKQYKRSEKGKAGGFIAAMQVPTIVEEVTIEENTSSNKTEEVDWDALLND